MKFNMQIILGRAAWFCVYVGVWFANILYLKQFLRKLQAGSGIQGFKGRQGSVWQGRIKITRKLEREREGVKRRIPQTEEEKLGLLLGWGKI